jgi:RanBP-type and C3HC4-type zinc finger-containing protein 1
MAQNLYQELQKANNSVGIIRNTTKFECKICLNDVKQGQGVLLRDCLHEFCDLCLVDHIKNNIDVQIKCPYIDKDYSCSSFLQQTEVKCIASPELYEKFLYCSLQAAEIKTPNRFHCQTVSDLTFIFNLEKSLSLLLSPTAGMHWVVHHRWIFQ